MNTDEWGRKRFRGEMKQFKGLAAADVEPMLVQLYDAHRLYSLAGDEKPQARLELGQIVASLLEAKLRPSERELVADILISLLRQAELDLRQALAERLSQIDHAPLRLILHLAQDEIDVASSILKHSPILNDLDLLYIIQSRSADYWRVIAQRTMLNEPVIDALADTKDIQTAGHLVENKNISLTPFAISVFKDLCDVHSDLAKPLLMRPEIPEEISRKLYEIVGQEIEAKIEKLTILARPVEPHIRKPTVQETEVLESVKDILMEFSRGKTNDTLPQKNTIFAPTSAMLRAAKLFHEKGQLTVDLMLKTLKRGQIQSFIAQFCVFAQLSCTQIHDMLEQMNGQGLAIVCKALRLKREDFISIYLLTQKVRRSDGLINRHEFNKSIATFDRLTLDVASRIYRRYV